MRLPRPSFRLRTLMVGVALIAAGMGGYAQYLRSLQLSRLREEYLARAADHDRRGQDFASRLSTFEDLLKLTKGALARGQEETRDTTTDEKIRAYWTSQGIIEARNLEDLKRLIAGYQAGADYHRELARKYRRCASRPWLVVALDPPAPADPMARVKNPYLLGEIQYMEFNKNISNHSYSRSHHNYSR